MVARAGLLVALLSFMVLAGCVGTDDADDEPDADIPDTFDTIGYQPLGFDGKGYAIPLLLCQPMLTGAESLHTTAERCNFNMTPDDARQGNEVTIAVNPADPKNVVGGAKDYYPTDAGECVWDGVYVSHDHFATETQDRSFDGSPWRLLAQPDTFSPNYASQFWCTTDPVAYFDVNGNLYYLLMAYQADRVTGSKTCDDICPNGALNDWAFNRAVQIVAKSTDGGDTFDTFTPVLEGTFPVNFHDKGWIAASRSGVIHVMWIAFLGPGNLYFRSVDGGQSFPPQEMELMATTAQGAGQGSFVEVGTNYEVYATWSSGGIHLRRSNDDGATWDEDRVVLEPNGVGMPGLSPRDRRGGFPAFATDRNPFSPLADALYYVWQDRCQDDWNATCEGDQGSAIYFSSSFDKGETFSHPVRVSTRHSGSETDWEIFPVVSVSPGGVIDVSWMDTEGAGNFSCDAQCEDTDYPGLTQHYSYSLDGGVTWSDEVQVRDDPQPGWDPKLSHHQNGMIFIGDYNDIDSSWQAAHPVWPDTRDGQYVKVYTATVLRPMFAEGWTPEKMEDAIAFIQDHPLK